MKRYKFEGYTITNCGYHQPDHCVWWEACDDDGMACFHGTTLREVEFMIIDSKWEDKLKAKDREIAKLRSNMNVAEDALEKITTGDFSHKDGDKPIVQVIIDIASNALFAIHEEGGAK